MGDYDVCKNKISKYMFQMRRISLTKYVLWGSVSMYYLQYQYFTRNREQQSDNFWKIRDLILAELIVKF